MMFLTSFVDIRFFYDGEINFLTNMNAKKLPSKHKDSRKYK